ncbi:unnamed protein product [Caenorhabditis auriculariae]|uniref:FLYWCH-type domain-containing protein n=1 Tax=Caenorhabditis auriculariae TaxID=2777116 RepID=A0A8S1GZ13_9PELO|nr:unnamed protein product [Caenorhabditis auriculariae]
MVNTALLTLKSEVKEYGDDADSCGESTSADGTPVSHDMLDLFSGGVDIQKVLEALTTPANPIGVLSKAIRPNEKRSVMRRYRRGNRKKVIDNGYVFTYDKDSSCGRRSFWRCERKSECPARVHTDPVTKSVLKRIHEHNHEPPSPEELPSWLKTEEDVIVVTAAAAPINSAVSSESCQTAAKTEVEEEMETEMTPAANVDPMQPKKRKEEENEFSGDVTKASESNNDFKEFVDVARRIMLQFDSLWKGQKTDSVVDCDCEVADFLDSHNFTELKSTFSKFTLKDMRKLSVEQIGLAVGSDINGVLLHNLLHEDPADNHDVLRIFVSETCKEDGGPFYQMLCLPHKTEKALREELEKMLIKVPKRLCVAGPGEVNVLLSDRIVATWKNEQIFELTTSKTFCRLRSLD